MSREKQQRDVQDPFPEEWSRPGIPGFAHGLKLDDHRIAQGHHGHGDDHSPQKSCAVMNGGWVVDEEGGQLWGEELKGHKTEQGKGQGEGYSPAGRRPGAFPAVRRHSGRPAGEADHWRRRWKNTGKLIQLFDNAKPRHRLGGVAGDKPDWAATATTVRAYCRAEGNRWPGSLSILADKRQVAGVEVNGGLS